MNDIVVGMGEALWDVLPEGKKLGGAPANFAYHISQFGLNSRVVSAVGDDKLGNEILESFREKKLYGIVDTVPYPTGTVQVELDAEGVPCYDIKEGVAWDNIPYTAGLEDLAKHTRAVCFGSLAQRSVVSRETINRFIDAMPKDDNVLKIFDINLRQGFYTKDILCNSFSKCNILKINDEELVTVSRMFGYPLAAYKELGIEAHGYVCDVTNEEAVNAMVAQIEKEVGVIDILVNNAGIIKRIPMCEMSAAEFRQGRQEPALQGREIAFDPGPGRLVRYRRGNPAEALEICLNAGSQPQPLAPGGEELFCRGWDGGVLAPGGILIRRA